MRNKMSKLVAAASVFLLSFSAAASFDMDLVPYVGADAQWRHMEFKKDYGKNLTKSNYPQGNVYVGVKLNPNVGLEAGYEQSTTIKKDAILLGRDIYFGQVQSLVAPNATFGYRTKTKIRAFHANVVGFLPISEEYCLQLIGSLGVARAKVNITHDSTTTQGLPDTSFHREFSKSKWIPKLGLGLQHMLTCQLGIRAMVGWEGTSRFKDIKPTNAPASPLIARTKDSYNLGLGLFYNFK